MRKSWLVCVCFGALAWGQTVAPPAREIRLRPPEPWPCPSHARRHRFPAADTPVLTVIGVCNPNWWAETRRRWRKTAASDAKTPAADCKTLSPRPN